MKLKMEPQIQQPNKYLQYLLVLDFQATCQNNVKLQPCSQIIQFPVILLSIKKLQEVSRFHQYVKPRLNPKLTAFCTQLTGIQQQQVDKGQILQDVLKDFDKWMDELRSKYLKEGNHKNYTFVTCGDWDLNICLKFQGNVKKINYSETLKHYINIKKYFIKVMKLQKEKRNRLRDMMEMLQELKIKHQGKHHSGIDDVINISQICITLIKDHGALFPKSQITTIKQ